MLFGSNLQRVMLGDTMMQSGLFWRAREQIAICQLTNSKLVISKKSDGQCSNGKGHMNDSCF